MIWKKDQWLSDSTGSSKHFAWYFSRYVKNYPSWFYRVCDPAWKLHNTELQTKTLMVSVHEHMHTDSPVCPCTHILIHSESSLCMLNNALNGEKLDANNGLVLLSDTEENLCVLGGIMSRTRTRNMNEWRAVWDTGSEEKHEEGKSDDC